MRTSGTASGMADTDVEIPTGRRHIIERPRLTRLLEATSARVIMLVAPAGYGKTTLARQWLANRPHAWYQAKPSSADVAGLAVSLAESLAELSPGAADRLSERLLATQDASHEIPALAQIQADALSDWPEGAWLAIDDYQFIASSEAAELYIDALLNSAPLRLLITSRVRPSWATSRHLLYGRFYELGRTPLAMADDEARRILTQGPRGTMAGFLALADGWPAVIALAALTDSEQPKDALPETLYEFLADELYQAASVPLQKALRRLAVCPPITDDLLDFLFGPLKGSGLLAEADRLGFLTTGTAQELDLHPLLRTFLLRKLREGDSVETAIAVRRIATFLLHHERWDDVFDIFKRYPLTDVLTALVENANEEMLRTGRLSTLADWLAASAEMKLEAPVLDIVQAEVALRQGNLARAETLAAKMTRRDELAKDIRSRAFSVAGQAAYLDNREADALAHYKHALKLARDRDSRRRASWGKLRCFHAYERSEDLHDALADFLQEITRDTDELLQAATAQVMVAANTGGLPEALESALGVKRVRRDARDPLVRTAYLNVLARSFVLLARYSDGLEFADEMIYEAERTRLTFVLPHAFVAKGLAELGLRHFGQAHSAIEQAQELSEEIGDTHNLIEVQTLRCKLAIATGDFGLAVEVTTDARWNRRVTPEMRAEYTANRALAFACGAQITDAVACANEAAALTALPEVTALVACVRAVAAIHEADGTAQQAIVDQALDVLFEYPVFDPLVVTYRGCPELLRFAASSIARRAALAKILLDAQDTQLARSMGFVLRTTRPEGILSPREAEVLELLSLGYTNREIADALYIAETTAKVHVQRILRKLGVRSRTEAALVALKERGS